MGVSGKAGNTPSEKQYTGLFVNRLPRSLRHARDGTSNTLLFGENRAAITWLGAEGWPVLHGLGDTPSRTNPLFTSLHPGVVMFATADGAVRGLSFDIEQDTLNNLAGMADGQIAKTVVTALSSTDDFHHQGQTNGRSSYRRSYHFLRSI